MLRWGLVLRPAGPGHRRQHSGRQELTADTEAGAQTEPPQAHTSALRRPRLSAPRYPVFILFTMTKAIYLFHLERKPGFFPSLRSVLLLCLHLPLPGMCAPHPSLSWAVVVACPHVGTRVSLCGSPDLQFPGLLLWVPEHMQYERLGGPVRKGCGAPRVSRQETDIFARGFPSLVFCGGVVCAFAFLAETSHVHPQKLWLPRAGTKKGG